MSIENISLRETLNKLEKDQLSSMFNIDDIDDFILNNIDCIKAIIFKLGTNSIQNYILTLSRELCNIESYPDKSTFSKIIDFGAKLLSILLSKNLLLKTTISVDNKETISICPNIDNEQQWIESIKKTYHIRTKHYTDIKSKIVDNTLLLVEPILHSVDIARVGKLNHMLKLQQDNIPILVKSSNLKGGVRVPKKIESIEHTNYINETKLIQEYVKDYDSKVIFMNHKYDKRGRMYTMSYPLSFQSDEFTRSSFELAFKSKVNDRGLTNLKLDIANLAGLDKTTTDNKLDWFNDAEKNILKVATLGKIDKRLSICKELDKPIRFLSACIAYKDALNDKAIGYMASIDSTASGCQLSALLTRDRLAAKYTNLTSENKRYDIYTEVAKEFYRLLGETNPFKHLTDRKRFKEAVMISGYNGKVAVERNFTSSEIPYFYQAYRNICSGMVELTDIINKAYFDNYVKPYMCWTMPDGFEVVCPQTKGVFKNVKTRHFNCMFRYNIVAPDEATNKRSLSPNIVHSIDAYVCRELLRRTRYVNPNCEVMSVHDSFYSHPNNIDLILSTYNNILQEMNTLQVDLVGSILSDIYGQKVSNPFKDREVLDDITNALYSLC